MAENSENPYIHVRNVEVNEKDLEPLKRRVAMAEIMIRIRVEGRSFLVENNAPQDLIDAYDDRYFNLLLQEAASRLCVDVEVIRNKENRTPEQQLLIDALAEADRKQQYERFFKSDFIRTQARINRAAIAEMQRLQRNVVQESELSPFNFFDIPDDETKALEQALRILNLDFYASHPDLDPEASDVIGEKELAEVEATTKAFIDFYNADKRVNGVISRNGYAEAVWNFLDPSDKMQITEISRNPFFGLPLSKVWREQNEIAKRGEAGAPINVGKKTEAGKVLIGVQISGKDGSPIDINDVDKSVQRGVGNLIDENGGRLPVCITPAQIFRAVVRDSTGMTVTEQQAAEVEATMDKLITSPSRIDYKLQLQKHRNIKQQRDYDYESPKAGYESGNLIVGSKKAIQAHDGTWTVGYIVYEYPMFYRYSHVVGEMAQVPNAFLTGTERPALKPTPTAEGRRNIRNLSVKEHVLTRVLRMTHCKQKKLQYAKTIRTADVAADCGITLTEKTERTLRKNIGLYLDELKAAGKIRAFSEARQSRKIVGYEITV